MQSYKQYMTEALTEAGLTDEQVTSAIEKMASNEKLSSKLNKLVQTATEDYTAQLGRVKTAEQEVQKHKDWYQTANAQYQKMDSDYRAALAELEAYKNGGAPPAFDEKKYMPKDDVVALLKSQSAQFGEALKDGIDVLGRHIMTYREPLDVQAIAKAAGERNITIRQAYDEWIGPRESERRKNEIEEMKKQAREEGYKDALSRHRLPVDPTPTETAPVFSKVSKESLPANIDDELMAVWSGAAQKS